VPYRAFSEKLQPFGFGGGKGGLFGFWLRFGSVTGLLANLLLRQRPMIGTTRQNPKILAPNGYSFPSNAPMEIF